jgi:hypothetical protein
VWLMAKLVVGDLKTMVRSWFPSRFSSRPIGMRRIRPPSSLSYLDAKWKTKSYMSPTSFHSGISVDKPGTH